MMDLSDGLAADLPRMCAASGCGAVIDPDALPVPDVLTGRADVLSLMTCGGEDYELLFTSAPNASAAEAPSRRRRPPRSTASGPTEAPAECPR